MFQPLTFTIAEDKVVIFSVSCVYLNISLHRLLPPPEIAIIYEIAGHPYEFSSNLLIKSFLVHALFFYI